MRNTRYLPRACPKQGLVDAVPKCEAFSYILGNPPYHGNDMVGTGQSERRFVKSLAELYDSLKMPDELLATHQRLDLAVDACYGNKKRFQSEAGRVGWLIGKWREVNLSFI